MLEAKRFSYLVLFLLPLLCLSPALVLAGEPAPVIGGPVTWEVANGRITSAGQLQKSPEGKLYTNFVIEADATSADPRLPFSKGNFRVNCSLFSPARNMPGQQAGRWYLRGDWTIVDVAADPRVLKTRHNPAIMAGSVMADLSFNPLRTPGKVEAKILLQRTAAKGRWGGAGKGRFSGNEKFEGTLTMDTPAFAGKGGANETAR